MVSEVPPSGSGGNNVPADTTRVAPKINLRELLQTRHRNDSIAKALSSSKELGEYIEVRPPKSLTLKQLNLLNELREKYGENLRKMPPEELEKYRKELGLE